jgi:hypothetical protein
MTNFSIDGTTDSIRTGSLVERVAQGSFNAWNKRLESDRFFHGW